MSRIGKKPIALPAGVAVTVDKDNLVTAKGPLGTLTQKIDSDMGISIEDGVLTVTRPSEQKRHKALHGLYRSWPQFPLLITRVVAREFSRW